MQEEWTIRQIGNDYFLYWGLHSVARFVDDLATEEMERTVEKLNEGTKFDGFARIVPG